MATITIKRKSESEYFNRLKDYSIFFDGKKIGVIANGQTKEFKTVAGEHTIIAKINWCSSSELSLTLDENHKNELTVGRTKNGNWIMPITIGIVAFYFFMKIVLNQDYSLFLVFPAFLLLVYYLTILTIGRKRYLALAML
jgi:hypothetical protein